MYVHAITMSTTETGMDGIRDVDVVIITNGVERWLGCSVKEGLNNTPQLFNSGSRSGFFCFVHRLYAPFPALLGGFPRLTEGLNNSPMILQSFSFRQQDGRITAWRCL